MASSPAQPGKQSSRMAGAARAGQAARVDRESDEARRLANMAARQGGVGPRQRQEGDRDRGGVRGGARGREPLDPADRGIPRARPSASARDGYRASTTN